jgi:two-component system, sensor histidine kinase and response regulator
MGSAMTYSPALETDVVRPGPDVLAPSSLHLLSTAPATRSQKQVRLAVVLVSLVTFLIGLPFVRVQLPGVAGFISAYEGALWTIDVVTAALIFGQFIQSRSRALLVLGGGYVFDALIVVPHALTFPGAFTPTGLLWAEPQTTAWLYEFWHGGFPLFVLAYALLPRGDVDRMAGDPARAVLVACATSIALVAALTIIATAGHDRLPVIMQDLDYTRAVRRGVGPVVWALTALALAALWLRKAPTSLDVWLSVAFVAWLLDVAFGAVIGAHRFDFGFYAGRIYGLMAASYVLLMLLIETYGLYGKLADAVKRLETKTEELQAVLDTAPAGIWFTDGLAASRIWSNRWGAEYLRLPSGVRASASARGLRRSMRSPWRWHCTSLRPTR